jgi:hypothetical protein
LARFARFFSKRFFPVFSLSQGTLVTFVPQNCRIISKMGDFSDDLFCHSFPLGTLVTIYFLDFDCFFVMLHHGSKQLLAPCRCEGYCFPFISILLLSVFTLIYIFCTAFRIIFDIQRIGIGLRLLNRTRRTIFQPNSLNDSPKLGVHFFWM